MTNLKSKVLIICGPTASGKTALAFKLAGDKPTSIISADSRQIYEDLDIITGKDIPKNYIKKTSKLLFNGRPIIYFESYPPPYEGGGKVGVSGRRGRVRLWGFNLLKPNESFNAYDFVALTNQIIARETTENRRIIIVGGSGFYLKALTEPLTLASAHVNEKLRQELNPLAVEALQQRLWEANPQKFLSLNDSDIKNPRRLIRALEVASAPSIKLDQSVQLDKDLEFDWIGIQMPIDTLKAKIRARVIARLNAGALDEVKQLLARYKDRSLPIYTSLGVKEIIAYFGNQINKDELINLWTTSEVNYAKRQITWFKKQPAYKVNPPGSVYCN